MFGGRFDHKVAITKIFECRRCIETGEHCLPLVFVQCALRDELGEVPIDRGEARLDAVFAQIVQRHVIPCLDADLSNTIAHLACANDSDFSNF